MSHLWSGDVASEVKHAIEEHPDEWVDVDEIVEDVLLTMDTNEETVRNTVEDLRRAGEVYGPMDEGLKVTP